MRLHEMYQAVNEANRVISSSDAVIDQMVQMISGRLHSATAHCSYRTGKHLARIKAELRDFDARTGQWKE